MEEPVASKLLEYCGHEKGTVYNLHGCAEVLAKAYKYEHLAKRHGCGVLVLTDFRDSKAACPPAALHKYWGRHQYSPSPSFLLRFAEAELESWLLADREAMAKFLDISPNALPLELDKVSRPKQKLVNLARKSRKTLPKNYLVPSKGHIGQVGPAYLSTMTRFVNDCWRPDVAAESSPSLNRCLNRLLELARFPSLTKPCNEVLEESLPPTLEHTAD